MIRAVLFDAGGTILHVHPTVGDVYAREASRFGLSVQADAVDTAFRTVWKKLRPSPDGATPFHTSEEIERAWWEQLVRSVFEHLGGLHRFNGQFNAFFNDLYLRFEQPDVWRLYDDVLPVLDALDARNMPYAIVSNWDSRLPRLLTAMNIADRFAFILTSAEAGFSKPAPQIFELAAATLSLPAKDILHVGDSIEEDAVPAVAAGLCGVHLARNITSTFTPSIDSLCALESYL